MRLYLVRHGQSSTNGKKIYQGQLDTDLTELGIEQAKKIADRLKEYKFENIYCSDLIRAKKTAQEIIKLHPKTKINYDERIREIDHGDMTGKNHDELKYEERKKDPLNYKFENGENYYDFEKRIREFLDEVINKNEDTLVVSHGGTIKVLVGLLLNLNPRFAYWERGVKTPNTSLYVIDVNNHKNKILVKGCNKHLN